MSETIHSYIFGQTNAMCASLSKVGLGVIHTVSVVKYITAFPVQLI